MCTFAEMLNDILSYMTNSPGLFNNTESGGECGVPHYHRFPMPRPAFDEPWSVRACVFNSNILCHVTITCCVSIGNVWQVWFQPWKGPLCDDEY